MFLFKIKKQRYQYKCVLQQGFCVKEVISTLLAFWFVTAKMIVVMERMKELQLAAKVCIFENIVH